jgi:AGZA family xanthine/uracil permease-like MFS transporter
VFGYFDWIFFIIPKPVIFPILIFVGLEITAQSFHATPGRHYPAVAFACVPALAYLAFLTLKPLMAEMGKSFADLSVPLQHSIQTVTVLAGGGGFIVTSLLWGTALAHMIDRRVRPLVATLLLAAIFSWFGVIHSPLPSSPIMPPGSVLRQLEVEGRAHAAKYQTPYHWAGAYVLMAIALLALHRFGPPTAAPCEEIAHSSSA